MKHPKLLSMNISPSKTSESRKTIPSDYIACLNLIVMSNKLAKSTKSLISPPNKLHAENTSWIKVFQRVGLCGLALAVFDMSHNNDCESYLHLGAHSDSVTLQIVLLILRVIPLESVS